MAVYEHRHDTVHWHMADIVSRIIAKSGIPSDRFHLGKIIMQSLIDNPNDVAQIEGTTGESETNSSILTRSVQCAISLKKLGFKQGDVMVFMTPNHLDLVVPFYAGLYLGVIVAPIDRFLSINELVDSFATSKPKIVFCQSDKVKDIRDALNKLQLEAKIISFDKGDGDIDFPQLLELGGDPKEVHQFRYGLQFRPTDFDPVETIAMLINTSGTTGLPKSSAATHKNFAVTMPYLWVKTVEIPSIKRSLVVAPLQWMTAIINIICAPFIRFTRVQSLQNMTQEHAYELINKYKPSFMAISATMMTTLLKPGDRENCDFTCFKCIFLAGSAVCTNLLNTIEKVTPKTVALNMYGMTEVTGISFSHGYSSPPHSCGKPMACLQYRLVDIETGRDVNKPNVNGELWFKGPGVFKGYYNNPEETKDALAEGGWLKSGDLLYRDENWNYYFVERIKLLLKYRNHQISPVEVEAVIRQHPGVLDVAVTGVPDPECGELPVACVVPVPGLAPTAQQIKDLVKDSLTDTKHLRGGVIFLEKLPTTSTTKVHRRRIKEMALTMERL